MNLDKELKIYLQMIRFLDESTDDYLYLYDFTGEKIYFTEKICKKYLLSNVEEGISFSEWSKIMYFKDVPLLEKDMEKMKQGITSSHNLEYRLVDREGNRIWINCRGKVQKDPEGKPSVMVGSISELSEGRMIDGLTKLWNYDRFIEDMGKYLKNGEGFLMILGIDNFKNINVKNGRLFGNHVLKIVTDTLEKYAENHMTTYRLDGDRFAVNMPGSTREEVPVFYENVREQLIKYCTVSAGAVEYRAGYESDGGKLYQYAENALDRAKKDGKNKLVFFSSDDYQDSLNRIRLQDEMKAAVQEKCKGFYLCYQPQVDSKEYTLYGAEALLRYESPSRGIVGPGEFIPILEQSGMICQIGEWVLRTAVAQCREWRKKIPDFHISVNISYVQLRQECITEMVLDVLEEYGIPGDALTLEITESIQLQDYSYFNKIFYEWKQYGIKISIDDFGTGYSSLSYLKSIDIDETKIDRFFVNRIHYNAYNYRLLSNMIELAHSARIQVCCEGVETEDELLALQKLHPDVLQGFFFAKPYKKKEFERIYIYEDCKEYQERVKKEKALRQRENSSNTDLSEDLRKEELGNIAEKMDEVICVSDIQTNELYYMNLAGCRKTGIYDYKGMKCYQVFHGRSSPCEFCTNKKLDREKFYINESENHYLKKRYIVRGKQISWMQKPAHLSIAFDITETEASLKKQIESKYNLHNTRGSLSYFRNDILKNTELGLWQIRIDPEHNRYEMYTDEVMDQVMGLKEPLPPEECYVYWYNRINEGYYNYVNQAVENIISSDRLVQIEYTWKHPDKGEVTVRCMGIHIEDQDGKICIEGYHRVISNLERLSFFPDGYGREIFEYNENKQAIYFHTDRTMISGSEQREYDFPECWIRSQIVHPHFVDSFRDVFTNVQKNGDMSPKEFLIRTKKGNYEWFNLTARQISEKERDAHTVIVQIESADQQRALELKYMRKTDFYEAMLSETVAYAEVDVESGHLTKAGGLWKQYETECLKNTEDFVWVFQKYGDLLVSEEDKEQYKHYLNIDYMKKMYEKGIATQKYSFRRYVERELRWMQLVIHVFQDRYSENMYALLYLKDIDAEKKRELAQEYAAKRDPLTNVYNRSVFEREVTDYMEKDQYSEGALLILDIDDFKMVNDKFGHLKGDETLKLLTSVLKSTFRSEDIVGRLGGDEFLVFVKGVSRRDILDRRMKELFEKLELNQDIPMTCSVGISLIRTKNFQYEEEVKKADAALYMSKKKGKNQYSYYMEQ